MSILQTWFTLLDVVFRLITRLQRGNPYRKGLTAQQAAASEFAPYKRYRKELAMPVFRELSSVKCLVVQIDIVSLLAGGVGRYNDNRQIFLDLFKTFRTDSSLGSRIMRLFKLWSRRLERVAFVAVKADMVRPSDIENKKLE